MSFNPLIMLLLVSPMALSSVHRMEASSVGLQEADGDMSIVDWTGTKLNVQSKVEEQLTGHTIEASTRCNKAYHHRPQRSANGGERLALKLAQPKAPRKKQQICRVGDNCSISTTRARVVVSWLPQAPLDKLVDIVQQLQADEQHLYVDRNDLWAKSQQQPYNSSSTSKPPQSSSSIGYKSKNHQDTYYIYRCQLLPLAHERDRKCEWYYFSPSAFCRDHQEKFS